MNGLPMPVVDSHSRFLVIAQSKRNARKHRLLALAARVKVRYDDFEAHKRELASIPIAAFDTVETDDLTDCYDNGTKELYSLLQFLEGNVPRGRRATCGYCGIGAPNTVDHYLPKSTFPEFAVMALNLVPCCYKCNSKKGNVFLEGERRVIFYLYGDAIPDLRYLFAEINYTSSVPDASFRLDPPQDIDASVGARIHSHYRKLDLLQRYNFMASEHLSEAMSSARTHCRNPGTSSDIRAFLRLEQRRLEADRGRNYWKAVLFEALANSSQFVHQCCSRSRI